MPLSLDKACLVCQHCLKYDVSQIFRETAMVATTMLHVRMDENIKEQATETLAAMAEADVIARKRRVRFATAAKLLDALEKGSGK
jgi:hypothetical protein